MDSLNVKNKQQNITVRKCSFSLRLYTPLYTRLVYFQLVPIAYIFTIPPTSTKITTFYLSTYRHIHLYSLCINPSVSHINVHVTAKLVSSTAWQYMLCLWLYYWDDLPVFSLSLFLVTKMTEIKHEERKTQCDNSCVKVYINYTTEIFTLFHEDQIQIYQLFLIHIFTNALLQSIFLTSSFLQSGSQQLSFHSSHL